MNYAQKFGETAQRVVKLFAEEVGTSVFRSLVDSSYDAESGVVTNTYLPDENPYIAFLGTEDKDLLVGSSDTSTDVVISTRKAIIAGLDITSEPKKNDVIIAADTGSSYTVDTVTFDMYKAKFTCIISLIPETEDV